MTTRATDDPSALRDLAVAVASEAGRFLADALHDQRTTVETKSTGTDMVTEMDRAAEALIVGRILDARPDDGVLGEEGSATDGHSGVRWVIDPLDGTTNYLYRLPGWNVSIGVEVEGRPAAGVVVIPGTGDTYAAAEGAGATWNGRPLALGDAVPLAEMLVGTGFSYDPERRAAQGRAVAALVPRIRDIRRVGAAAADLCAVAGGRLDAFYEAGLGPWDRCAGTVIARQAGYRVETFDDADRDPVTVAAHPEAWDRLVSVLAEVGALDRRF